MVYVLCAMPGAIQSGPGERKLLRSQRCRDDLGNRWMLGKTVGIEPINCCGSG